MDDNVLAHKVEALETDVRFLKKEAISRQWLEERFGRMGDKIDGVAEDLREDRSMDRSRRLAAYSAVAAGIVSLVVALVMMVITLSQNAPTGVF